MHKRSLLAGAVAAVAVRAALPHLVRAKLARDLRQLNAGDYRPLLSGYADDAVLHFNEGGRNRWAGRWVGKHDIERFLKEFVAAGLTGEFGRMWISGPPWALELCVRFDDRATAPNGEQIYANHNVIWARTRWGKVVEQTDFYENTGRIDELETKLRERGVPAAS